MNARHFLLLTLFNVFKYAKVTSSYRLVGYWGQNGGNAELDLNDYCENSAFDIVVIAFVNNFENDQNKDSFPSINLSKHCGWSPHEEYPQLFKCPSSINTAINLCQSKGKKVYISLGGAVGTYGLKDEAQAKKFAETIWNLFLGGDDPLTKDIRPFGSAILDGVDLDIEQVFYHNYDGYATFTKTLHTYMKNDPSKNYYISGAPQCPYPDQNMKGVLKEAGSLLDELFIQYYNNFCAQSSANFEANFKTWINYANISNPDMKIYVGLPAHQNASGNALYYKTPNEVEMILKFAEQFPQFDGFMLWDAGYDSLNKINGQPYSKHVKHILETGVYDPALPTTPPKNFQLAVQWGSNKAFKVAPEKDIVAYCKRKSYDIFIINELPVFFDDNNKGDLPGLNFAKHCTGTFGHQIYPTYLNCPKMANQIKECQTMKKTKFLLSIGANSRWPGFRDKQQAEKFAENLWNLFLGGEASLRTFGKTVLDGINLDIRWGKSSWFPDFVVKLREYMNTDRSRKYLITSNPVCAWPHHSLGDTFATHSKLFDHLFINFDDKGCPITSEKDFTYALNIWLSLPGPQVFIGMPSSQKAAVNPTSYLSRTDVTTFIKKYMYSNDRIEGILLDDASWDDDNMVNGQRYSDYVGEIIKPSAYVTKAPGTCTTNCGGGGGGGAGTGKTGKGAIRTANLITILLLLFINIIRWFN